MTLRAIEFLLADEAKRHEGPEKALLDHASSTIIGLRNRLATALKRNRKLEYLETHGVEDWTGYEQAMIDYKESWPSDFDDGTC